MKTSFEEIMNQDFERFLDENMDGIGDLDFKALGGGAGGRKSILRECWRQAVETAAGFNLLDYLVFASPAAALVAIIFVGKSFVERVLQAYMQGM